MTKSRKYRKNKRGGVNKTCRQNDQDWRQHWNPVTSKRGAIPMRVKKQCCEKFDKNTRYYGAWNIMKGARYPDINGMKDMCDDYIPNDEDISNYTKANPLNESNDPYHGIPFASVSYPISKGEPVAKKVQSSDELV